MYYFQGRLRLNLICQKDSALAKSGTIEGVMGKEDPRQEKEELRRRTCIQIGATAYSIRLRGKRNWSRKKRVVTLKGANANTDGVINRHRTQRSSAAEGRVG